MRANRTAVALGILGAVFLTAGGLWAGMAKFEGDVVDQAENPIAGAVVTVRATDGSYESSDTTNRKGKFSFTIRDFAPVGYTFRVEAAGFAPNEGPLELREGATLNLTIPMLNEEAAAQQRAEIAAIEARNKAARRYNEGANKFNEGKLEEAIALFKEAVAEEEDLVIAWAGLGRIYLEQERWAEAAEAFERYEAIEPGQGPVLLLLYDSYQAMGEEAKASALLDRLVEEFPNENTAARIFNLGVAAVKKQDLETARELFQKSVAMGPGLYQAHLNLAQIARAYSDWETTLTEVEVFLAEEPEHPRALALRYQALNGLQSPDAPAALDQLRESAPGEAAQIFHKEGVTLFNAGETQQALDAFLAAIDIQPAHARAHYRAGLCYASLKDNGQAKAYLEKFIELAPEDPETATAREMLTYL